MVEAAQNLLECPNAEIAAAQDAASPPWRLRQALVLQGRTRCFDETATLSHAVDLAASHRTIMICFSLCQAEELTQALKQEREAARKENARLRGEAGAHLTAALSELEVKNAAVVKAAADTASKELRFLCKEAAADRAKAKEAQTALHSAEQSEAAAKRLAEDAMDELARVSLEKLGLEQTVERLQPQGQNASSGKGLSSDLATYIPHAS